MGKSQKQKRKTTNQIKTTSGNRGQVEKKPSRKISPPVLFMATFLGLLLAGSIAYPFLSIKYDYQLHQFMSFTALICGKAIALFSNTVSISDQYVTFKGFSIEVIEECTGIMEMLIFAAAVLSYRASWKAKAIGLIAGLPALYIFNVVRIIFLTLIGAYYHNLFGFMHLYFWQATLILMITTVWVLWVLLVVNHAKKTVLVFP